MARVAKTAKAKVATRQPAARKSAPEDKRKPGLARRLNEALEQHIAISEILRVISNSPGDVKPMLNAVAERALKLCDATQATIVLIDGDALRCAAAFGSTGTLEEGEVMPLTRGSVAGRAIRDAAPFQIVDLAKASEEEFPVGRELQRRIGHHTALAVPLMRGDRAIGAIQLWRMEIRAFSESQIALVTTFAEQAAIAIENVRLFKELEARNADTDEVSSMHCRRTGRGLRRPSVRRSTWRLF